MPDQSPPQRAAFHSLPGDTAGGLGLRSLFLDLNAYFASVEQQHNPELRGRPVAVAPVLADAGCCVAASYEAKAMGVKTGMRCAEARRLCPDITIVKTRHRAYIEVHHKIIEAVETCLPVEQVMSIDEMACRLSRHEQTVESARALGEKVKRAIATKVGECLRCSVGVAPNRFLAKVATDMQKPDGLVVLTLADLPHALFHLRLQDLAGIGPRMAKRLESCGINSVRELSSRSENDLEHAWGGVVGRYWYRWLRGEETAGRPTRRRSIGHQHVLGPESRNTQDAWAICVRLLHKAASRMRSLDYFAQKISLSLKFTDDKGAFTRGPGWGWQGDKANEHKSLYWSDYENLEGGKQDIMTLTERLSLLWSRRATGTPAFVGVTLHDMLPAASVTVPLFPQDRRRQELSRLIDELDEKHGPLTVYTAAMHEARSKAMGGIAFRHVPDLELPDTVV